MKSFKLKIFVSLILITSVILFAGCGEKKSQPQSQGGKKEEVVTITFVNWVSAEEGTRDQMKDIIANFEKENPNIKIEVKPVPVSDIMKELTTRATGGNPPDIAQVQGDNVVTLAASNFIEPIDSLIPQAFLNDIPKNIYDAAGLYKGQHYAIPWAPVENGFWYNKKLMQEAGLDPNKPPQTLEELDQAIKQAKTKLPKDVIMLQLDTTVRTIGLFHQWPFMLAFNNGVPPVDSNNNINVNTEGMKTYGEWIRRQVKEGNTLPGKKYGEFRPMMAQNRVLFGFDGTFVAGTMKSLNKTLTDKDIYETWGMTALPAGKDGKHYAADTNHCLVIFKGTKHPQEAMKFAEYLANSDYALTKYFLPVGYAPITKSAPQRVPKLMENPIVKSFVEKVLTTIVPLPYGPNYPKMSEIIMSSVQEIITTDKPVSDILANAQTKLEELYKK